MKKKTQSAFGAYVHPGSISMAVLTAFLFVSVFAPMSSARHKVEAASPVSAMIDRLVERLHGSSGDLVSSQEALALLETRVELMTHKTVVRFIQDQQEIARTEVALREHPSWIVLDASGSAPRLAFDGNQVAQGVERLMKEYVQLPVNCGIGAVTQDDYGIWRTNTKCVAKEGVTFDKEAAAHALSDALLKNTPAMDIELVKTGGIIDASAVDMSFPDLLSVGTSNFEGSPWGREKNIHKAIEEKINGVVVMPGEELSFNKLLGPRVTQGNGWAMALGIFGGGELRPTPGGGICQTSTTVYRAALLAGLPITVQRNHSLFVHYYEVGGVGLDATVFYGHQDLKFQNDTGHPILIQAEVQGDDVTVAFFGTHDGRVATLRGPFVPGHDGGTLVNNRPIRNNEIVWYRDVVKADGTVTEEQLVSRYKSVPNYVRRDVIEAAKTPENVATAL